MLVPPIVLEDAISLCANTPADETATRTGLPAAFASTSDSTRACDYSVFEVTGTANQGIMLSITDLLPKTSGGAYPLSTPYTLATQSTCSQSYVDYEVAGWVPPKFALNGQQVTVVPGYWQVITKETVIGGCWGNTAASTVPHCNLGIEGTGPADSRHLIEGTYSYPTIRVVAKSVVQLPSGPARGPLYIYKEPE
jgi:hypothetical protein